MLKPIKDLVLQLMHGLAARPIQTIPLDNAINRVVAIDVLAAIGQPFFNESLRDGFALHRDFSVSVDGSAVFDIGGEIAAGDNQKISLAHQQACRIMTGAPVPQECLRVVPEEDISRFGNHIRVTEEILQDRRYYIKSAGSEVEAGELMIQAGTVLTAAHLARLAAVAVDHVEVFKKPRIGFFCTGKELVHAGADLVTGKKVSSNHYLLSGLIVLYGGKCCDLGLVDDESLQLQCALLAAGTKKLDVLISTGGTGPGKFDLVEKKFRELGGQLYSTNLGTRPGKSVVIGKINNTIFCGLPGPPGAVEALLHEFVGPIILQLQGVKGDWPQQVEAYLETDIKVKSLDVVQLKSGIHQIKGGKCNVRRVRGTAQSTCNVVIPQKTKKIPAGTLVDVHLKSSPFYA